MAGREIEKPMPYFANLPKLAPTTYNGISTFHQLPGVYHPGNVGLIAGLQIVLIILIPLDTRDLIYLRIVAGK
jgi:hypothetical protein